ncbi:MAG: glutamate-cysteine ligase family protein [Planctomycetota bacterium]
MSKKLGLFDAYGVELEYMIVSRGNLNVLPICDRLIESECGRIESEIERGSIAWSNELVLHVVELKTAAPSPSLSGLHQKFHEQVRHINRRLETLGGRLMPSAMHPWMDPFREMKLWPHEYSAVYEAFNRIFDCRGHGWANLQSVHLNLPFNGDEEFGRLHAAVRLVLPLLPAIAAASPVVEGRVTGRMDHRLNVYRTNSLKIPMITGRVIPEQAFTEAEYHRQIFEPLFREISPHDPEGVLQDEFLNARGAIARFGRGSIEIRVIDIQECPAADLAVLQATVAVLKALVSEKWSSLASQQSMPVEPLSEILLAAIDKGEQAVISNTAVLSLFGIRNSSCTLQQLGQSLYESTNPDMDSATRRAFEAILDNGPLARRMTRSLARDNSILRITEVAQELCDCLAAGRQFGL